MLRHVVRISWANSRAFCCHARCSTLSDMSMLSDGNRRWVHYRPAGFPEFNVPHSVALDKAGLVYIADRGNPRIQVFDAKGAFIREMQKFVRK